MVEMLTLCLSYGSICTTQTVPKIPYFQRLFISKVYEEISSYGMLNGDLSSDIRDIEPKVGENLKLRSRKQIVLF